MLVNSYVLLEHTPNSDIWWNALWISWKDLVWVQRSTSWDFPTNISPSSLFLEQVPCSYSEINTLLIMQSFLIHKNRKCIIPKNDVLSVTLNSIWWWSSSLEIWWIWSTPSLPLLSGPLWPGMVVPVRVPSMGQIEKFNYIWNHLIVCKQISSGLF